MAPLVRIVLPLINKPPLSLIFFKKKHYVYSTKREPDVPTIAFVNRPKIVLLASCYFKRSNLLCIIGVNDLPDTHYLKSDGVIIKKLKKKIIK